MFQAPKLTDAGRALYYDNLAGTQIVFTSIKLGSGYLTGPIASMTNLVTPVVTIDAAAKSVSEQYAEISGHFSNADLAAGFYWREIGIFAADPADPDNRAADILYCYQNAYETADFIPVASVETVEKAITVPVIVGDAAAVSCVLSASLILATLEDLNNHNTSMSAHEKLLEKFGDKIKAEMTLTIDDLRAELVSGQVTAGLDTDDGTAILTDDGEELRAERTLVSVDAVAALEAAVDTLNTSLEKAIVAD